MVSPRVPLRRKHTLFILRKCKNTNIVTVQSRVKSSGQAAFSLMRVGFTGLNGTGQEVALTQYKTYVLPTLVYGLEALVLGKKELKIFGAYHRKVLYCIQYLSPSTAIPAIICCQASLL